MGSTRMPPVSLAPFAFDWVGGDIHGLQALSVRLSSYVPAITDVTTALDRRAGQLTSDGPDGWQGSAASAFTAAWGRDALTAGALAAVIDQASQITGWLAVALAQIENALETQADAAAGHRVAIMPGGQPGPEPDGPPANAAEAAVLTGPAEHGLQHDVQLRDRGRGGYQQQPPDQRADPRDHHPQLISVEVGRGNRVSNISHHAILARAAYGDADSAGRR